MMNVLKINTSILFACFVIIYAGPITGVANNVIRVKKGSPVSLECEIEGNSEINIKLKKIGEPEKTQDLNNRKTNIRSNNGSYQIMKLKFDKVTYEDNGTYECNEEIDGRNISKKVDLLVTDVPEIINFEALTIDIDSIYLNWTINNHNDMIKEYKIEHYRNESTGWESMLIKNDNEREKSSFIVNELQPETSHRFRITATNSIGDSELGFTHFVQTLSNSTNNNSPYFKASSRINYLGLGIFSLISAKYLIFV